LKKKIALILTDSVALPRGNAGTTWEDTYIHKLREKHTNYHFINVSIGGASIKDLRKQVNYYKILSPDLVVLQCGIVDASPRAFGRIEIQLIKKLHIFRFTKPFVSFLRKYRGHHYANQKEFRKYLGELQTELKPKKFIALGIIPASDEYENKIPGVSKAIKQYNEILSQKSIFLSTENLSKKGITKDHHHINKIGQEHIFNLLNAEID
jgi:hypothetical protein